MTHFHFSHANLTDHLKQLSTFMFSVSIMVTSFIASGFVYSSSFDSSSINVTLQQPKWQFLLNNQPLTKTEARIAPNERDFAKKIQPLLDQQNYSAVMIAFTEKGTLADCSNISTALCQLRGQVQLLQKDYEGAEKSLQHVLTEFPNLAIAHRSLSMVYMVNKAYKKARLHLSKTIELGTADAQVFGQLAFVNLQLGQAASAISGYQQALFLAPNDKQWQQGLLFALLNSNAYDQAQALLEEMLAADINNSELWLQRGQLALKQNRLSQAITSLEVALILGDNTIENLGSAAKLHLQAGSANRAVEILVANLPILLGQQSTTNATNKKHANQAKMDIATIESISAWLASQEEWQQLTKLLQALDKFHTSLPTHYQAKFDVYHAQINIANNNIDKAQKRLTRALEINPNHGEALLSLAKLYKSQQRDEQALQYFVRAQALTNYQERALLGQAQLEIDRKKYSEAITLLHQVVQINPERRDVLANIKTLKHILRNQS